MVLLRATASECFSGKERTLNGSTGKSLGRLPAWTLAALAAATALSGCGTVTDVNKGWLDPTAVGRFQGQPLVVPILNSVDRTVEEPNEEYLNATDVRAEDLKATSSDYKIGKNDLISVAITDLVSPGVETVKTSRVSESGNISMPLIGPLKAAGLSEAELEHAISAAYNKENLIQNAQVSVTVTEARARTFSILGAVAAPGQYAIVNSDFRVLDALVLGRDVNAQGVTNIYVIRKKDQDNSASSQPATQAAPAPADNSTDLLTPRSDASGADHAVLLQTTGATTQPATAAVDDEAGMINVDGRLVPATAADAKPAANAAISIQPRAAATTKSVSAQGFEFGAPVPAGDTRVIRIPYEQLKRGDLRYNIVIRPQDMVIVEQPVIGEYYMGGHVARIGVYSLTGRKITLKQAIVAAGMFDQLAIPARTQIIRRLGPEREVFATMDLDKVFDGSQPDIYLKPNDVVQVGTNALAPFLAAVRGAFRITYGFGFLYDRNFATDRNGNFR